jgi:hypothetical protein
MRSPFCLCLCESPPINFWIPEPIFMKLGTCIKVAEPISVAYFLSPSHQSVCLYVYAPIVAKQQLGTNVTIATNVQTTIEELLDVSFSMQSMSYQRNVDD